MQRAQDGAITSAVRTELPTLFAAQPGGNGTPGRRTSDLVMLFLHQFLPRPQSISGGELCSPESVGSQG